MQAPAFGLNPSFHSGHTALEFTNTVNNHAGPDPGETLFKYGDLIGWGERVGLLTQAQVRALTRKAASRPREAAAVLSQSIRLREALYRAGAALAGGGAPTMSDLAILNAVVKRAANGAGIAAQPGGFAWDWNLDETALDLPLRLIALAAVDLLTSQYVGRIGQCADEHGCGWLFIDSSKNHSRRWCDINDCGNRAKQRRHRLRKS